MYTFITLVTTPHPSIPFTTLEVAAVETRALTAAQAEKQALAKADLTVRNSFGQVIDSPELTVKTFRKFTVEVR